MCITSQFAKRIVCQIYCLYDNSKQLYWSTNKKQASEFIFNMDIINTSAVKLVNSNTLKYITNNEILALKWSFIKDYVAQDLADCCPKTFWQKNIDRLADLHIKLSKINIVGQIKNFSKLAMNFQIHPSFPAIIKLVLFSKPAAGHQSLITQALIISPNMSIIHKNQCTSVHWN